VPVVSVLALRPDDGSAIQRSLAAVVSGVAEALDAPSAGTWAHFVAVNAVHQGRQSMDFPGHCPIVIVRGTPRDKAVVAAVLTAAANAVASNLGVPLEDVWVQWVDVLPGHVFAGGEVLT
jgi:phenylpyruvate tautomerase PptA (4-oxalocrotonate tautomerase family)